jgi:hypothetical protein
MESSCAFKSSTLLPSDTMAASPVDVFCGAEVRFAPVLWLNVGSVIVLLLVAPKLIFISYLPRPSLLLLVLSAAH